MATLYLPSNFDLSNFKRIGNASKYPLVKKNFHLVGKYTLKANQPILLKIKACLLIILTLGMASLAECIRAALKGHVVRVIYIQECKLEEFKTGEFCFSKKALNPILKNRSFKGNLINDEELKQSQEQKNCMQLYTSLAEIKQLLAMMGHMELRP